MAVYWYAIGSVRFAISWQSNVHIYSSCTNVIKRSRWVILNGGQIVGVQTRADETVWQGRPSNKFRNGDPDVELVMNTVHVKARRVCEKLEKQTRKSGGKDSLINSSSSSPLMQHTSNDGAHLECTSIWVGCCFFMAPGWHETRILVSLNRSLAAKHLT